MKLFLFICTILIFQKGFLAQYPEYYDLREIGYRSLLDNSFQDNAYGYRADTGYFQDNYYNNDIDMGDSLSIWSFLKPTTLLPSWHCRDWACSITFPNLLGILPRISVRVGIEPSKLQIWGQLIWNDQVKYSKVLGLTNTNLCIPFTSTCLKFTYIKLPWGPICSEFNGRTLPCVKMNGLWPSFFYPQKPQTNPWQTNPWTNNPWETSPWQPGQQYPGGNYPLQTFRPPYGKPPYGGPPYDITLRGKPQNDGYSGPLNNEQESQVKPDNDRYVDIHTKSAAQSGEILKDKSALEYNKESFSKNNPLQTMGEFYGRQSSNTVPKSPLSNMEKP